MLAGLEEDTPNTSATLPPPSQPTVTPAPPPAVATPTMTTPAATPSAAGGPHSLSKGRRKERPSQVEAGVGPVVAQRVVGVAAQYPEVCEKASSLMGQVPGKTVYSLCTLLHDNVHEPHPAVLLAALAVAAKEKAAKDKPDAVSLTAAAQQDIGCRIGKPFTIDCSCLPHASVPTVCSNVCTTVEQTLNTDLAGHHMYMHAPAKHMPALVQHYVKCKSVKPDQPTSAVFVVTDFLYRKHADLFKGMHVLQTYNKGSPVNLKHWDTGQCIVSTSYSKLYVLYDGSDVEAIKANTTESHTLQPTAVTNQEEEEPPPLLYNPPPVTAVFKGLVSGAAATVGADSFCQGFGFIQPAFVEQHNLTTAPIPRMKVKLGDGIHTAYAERACKVHVKLASFSAVTWLLVMQVPGEFDVLLGDQFLVTHNAQLVFGKALVVQTATRKHTIPTIAAAADKHAQDRTPKYTTTLLSSHQLARAVRKGAEVVLCHIQKLQPTSGDGEPTTPAEVLQLIEKYPSVFPTTLQEPNPLRPDMPTVIPTDPAARIPNQPPFRYNPAEIAEIQQQVQDLLEQGLIQPSTSPYGAPVLLVKKKDGSKRMCVDYRALNHITVKNAAPLPRIDDLLDRLQGAKYFSSLDLLSGYHQLSLKPEDVPKTAFKTTSGLYEYKVLCFGLANAPSVFQAIMNKIFSSRGLLNKSVLVYMDDILIFSRSRSEHLKHIEEVLKVLKAENFSAKLKKCQFFRPEVSFLGHIISAEGIKPDPDKVNAVQAWPIPKTQTELRGFLGLTNYFRRFIRGYSHIAAPLLSLTRKDSGSSVLLSAECLAAFHELKRMLATAPVLRVPDFEKPFRLVTDASQVGMGGVLTQDGQAVAYESKKFSSTEMNYSTSDRELYAVVHCLKKWKVYMMSNPENVVVTDHKPNVTIHSKTELSPRQVRWIEFLQQFPIKWVYEKGASNIADPLSRFSTFLAALLSADLPAVESTCIVLAAIAAAPAAPDASLPDPPADLAEDAAAAEQESLQLIKLLHSIKEASKSDPYTSNNNSLIKSQGVFFHKDRIYVPNTPELRTQVIAACHNSLFAGHMGKHHTAELVQRWFYWPKLIADVAKYVASCHTCQLAKTGKHKSQGLLRPLSVPDRPWWSVSVDFITGLPSTNRGHDAILTITDRLTRLVHLVPTTTTCNAEEFAYLFKNHVISKHGCPADIVSDRGSVFSGKFWTTVCHALQLHMSMSTAFHPQSDGATETVNKMVEQVLRCHCMDSQDKWDDNLCMVEFALNNSHHESTKHTPFFLNFGMHPLTPLHIETIKLSKTPAAAKWTNDLISTLDKAKLALQQAKDRQKSYADANRKETTFSVGDKVLLATTNLSPKAGTRKLFPRWLGPFTVTKVVNDVAYQIELPPSMKIHNVFHVSLLKPFHHDGKTQPPPPPVTLDGHLEYEVEDLLGVRKVKAGSKFRQEFLVKWKGYGHEHCTWEPETHLTNCSELLSLFWKAQALKQAALDTRKESRTVAARESQPSSKRRRKR